MTKSILTEVRENSLDELFSRDPLDLTDADLDKMIGLYRAKRDAWAKGEATKAPIKREAPAKLSLDDLGI